MGEPVSVRLVPVTEPPWTELRGVALGHQPAGRETPVLHGLVSIGDQPHVRLDLYGEPGSESYFRSEAIVWGEWIAVGHGYSVYLTPLAGGSSRAIGLRMYFQAFVPGASGLLVVNGEGLALIELDGTLRWYNGELAVDGVQLDAVDWDTDRVCGRGEWDPPGDWRPFEVRLSDGRTLVSPIVT